MTPAQELAEEALKARRRELALALRACRPHERLWLRKLPEHRYEPYGTANALGMSNKTVMNMLKRPRVKRAMEVFLQDALDEIGISHTSLVADLVEIKKRCMQAEPVLDKKGQPTGVYQFDSRGAIAAIQEIAELRRLAPPKRLELTGADGGPIETAGLISGDMDADEAARVYQDIIRGSLQ